jgi:hypothetical protein
VLGIQTDAQHKNVYRQDRKSQSVDSHKKCLFSKRETRALQMIQRRQETEVPYSPALFLREWLAKGQGDPLAMQIQLTRTALVADFQVVNVLG